VTAGVIALGDKNVVFLAIFDGGVQGDGGALFFLKKKKSKMSVDVMLGKEFAAQQPTINCSSILPRRSRPGASSRWWLADVSAIVETIAIQ